MKRAEYNLCKFYTLQDGSELVVFKGKPIAVGHMEWQCPRGLPADAVTVMEANHMKPNTTAYTTQRYLNTLWKKERDNG